MPRTITINGARYASPPSVAIVDASLGTGEASVNYVTGTFSDNSQIIYPNTSLNGTVSVPIKPTDTIFPVLSALVQAIAAQEGLTLGANGSGPDHIYDSNGAQLA